MSDDRSERRAAALRANLRRRKAQAREGTAAAADPLGDPAPDPGADQCVIIDPAA